MTSCLLKDVVTAIKIDDGRLSSQLGLGPLTKHRQCPFVKKTNGPYEDNSGDLGIP